MLKVNKCRRNLKKAPIFILASMLFTSAIFNNAVTVHAQDNTRIEAIDESLNTCDFSKETRKIIKEIANTTNSDIVLRDLKASFNSDEYSEYFLAQGISSFAQEQEKIKYSDAYLKDQYNPFLYISYDIDDISIINNLNGGIRGLKNQIYLLNNLANFGDFSLYEVHDDTPSYIISSKDGRVLTVSTGDRYIELKNQDVLLTSFRKFLSDYEMSSKVKESYSYDELFADLTFQISAQISIYKKGDNVRSSDVLVVDTNKSLTNSSNKDRDYYFIKYVYPYLFIQGRDVYEDPSNMDAKITVDELKTLIYYDAKNDMSLFDLDMHFVDGGQSSSSLVNFSKFMKDNNKSVGLYVTDEYLRELSDLFNAKPLDTGKALTQSNSKK